MSLLPPSVRKFQIAYLRPNSLEYTSVSAKLRSERSQLFVSSSPELPLKKRRITIKLNHLSKLDRLYILFLPTPTNLIVNFNTFLLYFFFCIVKNIWKRAELTKSEVVVARDALQEMTIR